MTPTAERFAEIFHEEHREVRDVLLGLVDALESCDRDGTASLLERLTTLTGPHFRYEEEALYPALVPVFGDEYVEKLLRDHDGAIAGVQRLLAFAERESLAEAEVVDAVRVTRAILPHVSDCDGLSIIVEVLPEERVADIFAARDRALAEGLDLLDWARAARSRDSA